MTKKNVMQQRLWQKPNIKHLYAYSVSVDQSLPESNVKPFDQQVCWSLWKRSSKTKLPKDQSKTLQEEEMKTRKNQKETRSRGTWKNKKNQKETDGPARHGRKDKTERNQQANEIKRKTI